MNKKTITIVLCGLIIGAFFLPYLSGFGNQMSGYDLVFGKYGYAGIAGKGSFKFINLLVPLGAAVILLGELLDDRYAKGTFIRLLPLIGLAYMLVMIYLPDSGQFSFGDLLSLLSYGFWLSLAAALALPFTR
jgi:hypothetical protein